MDYNVYNFAAGVLFEGKENTVDHLSENNRDAIFNWVLEEFKDKPLKVYQVGAIETFRIAWRVGSGWSDTIFGPHIQKNGGKLTVADVNIDNIAHSLLAAKSLEYEVNLVLGDAIHFIDAEPYDVYYLDGSNDPQETLDQFNKIKDNKCIVIVDDFSIKGTLLKDYDFVIKEVANQVGILDMRDK